VTDSRHGTKDFGTERRRKKKDQPRPKKKGGASLMRIAREVKQAYEFSAVGFSSTACLLGREEEREKGKSRTT